MKLVQTKKKWFGILLSLLLVMMASELFIRGFLLYLADFEQYEMYASTAMLENGTRPTRIKSHPSLGIVNNPVYKSELNRHNSLGFRGEDILDPKPKEVVRIICVGSSTTYGNGVEDYQQTYPYLLGETLKKQGYKVEVINAGVEGYHSRESLLQYSLTLQHLSPDILLFHDTITDLWNRFFWPPESYTMNQSRNLESSEPLVIQYVRKISLFRVMLVSTGLIKPDINSHISHENNFYFDFRSQMLRGAFPEGIFETIPADSMIQANHPAFIKNNLTELIQLAKNNDTKILLSTSSYSTDFPEMFPELTHHDVQVAVKEQNALIRNLSAEHDLPLIDFERHLKPEKGVFSDGIHYTPRGNQKRVELIIPSLIPLLNQSGEDSGGV